MRNHIVIKAVALCLCALTLLCAVASGATMLLFASMDLSETYTVDDAYEYEMKWNWRSAAEKIAQKYAAETLGGMTPELSWTLLVDYRGYLSSYGIAEDAVVYTIADADGTVLASTYDGMAATAHTIAIEEGVQYPRLLFGPIEADSPEEAYELLDPLTQKRLEDAAKRNTPTAAAAREADATAGATEEAPVEGVKFEHGRVRTSKSAYFTYCWEDMPAYTVTLYLAPNARVEDVAWGMLRTAWSYRQTIMMALGVSLLLCAVCVVYLCCAAGRGVGVEGVHPGGLNRLPLDVYALLALGLVLIVVFFGIEGVDMLLRQGVTITLLAYGYAGFLCSLAVVGFCYAFVAQIKTPGRYWLKNTLFVRCILLGWKLLRWFVKKLPQWAGSLYHLCRGIVLWCWGLVRRCFGYLWQRIYRVGTKLHRFYCMLPQWAGSLYHLCRGIVLWCWGLVRRCFGYLWQRIYRVGTKLHRFYCMLPLIWQWLLVGGCMLLLLLLSFTTGRVFWVLAAVAVCAAGVCYGANYFGILLRSTQRMREGDLSTQVDKRHMLGAFRVFATELNGLAGVAMVAAQKQLNSERMKTELITNVSHDIKTPLTSIINYVDLLQTPHSPEDEKMYLEILARQSARLKKLIEDLIEMSKASTGNIQTEITRVNAVEAVNQALGEFMDKLEAAQLIIVYDPPKDEVPMYADGRLVWRAMSNLLSNAVKYAMPGTRLYVDIASMNGRVMISFKNVSRDALNVRAEELMERFVRGDASRNTEGSGLGLNIAKSLMELQNGELQLLVDGDLFKVTLIFPGVEE